MDTDDIRNFAAPTMVYNEGMKVERVPLPEEYIRLQALKAAVESSSKGDFARHVLRRAQEYENYVREGQTLEFHNDETLVKVARVLDSVGSISYTGTEIISMLQNEGILFRERR